MSVHWAHNKQCLKCWAHDPFNHFFLKRENPITHNSKHYIIETKVLKTLEDDIISKLIARINDSSVDSRSDKAYTDEIKTALLLESPTQKPTNKTQPHTVISWRQKHKVTKENRMKTQIEWNKSFY